MGLPKGELCWGYDSFHKGALICRCPIYGLMEEVSELFKGHGACGFGHFDSDVSAEDNVGMNHWGVLLLPFISGKLSYSMRVLVIIFLDKVRCMYPCGWFPGIVRCGVSFPLNEVLKCLASSTPSGA